MLVRRSTLLIHEEIFLSHSFAVKRYVKARGNSKMRWRSVQRSRDKTDISCYKPVMNTINTRYKHQYKKNWPSLHQWCDAEETVELGVVLASSGFSKSARLQCDRQGWIVAISYVLEQQHKGICAALLRQGLNTSSNNSCFVTSKQCGRRKVTRHCASEQ